MNDNKNIEMQNPFENNIDWKDENTQKRIYDWFMKCIDVTYDHDCNEKFIERRFNYLQLEDKVQDHEETIMNHVRSNIRVWKRFLDDVRQLNQLDKKYLTQIEQKLENKINHLEVVFDRKNVLERLLKQYQELFQEEQEKHLKHNNTLEQLEQYIEQVRKEDKDKK